MSGVCLYVTFAALVINVIASSIIVCIAFIFYYFVLITPICACEVHFLSILSYIVYLLHCQWISLFTAYLTASCAFQLLVTVMVLRVIAIVLYNSSTTKVIIHNIYNDSCEMLFVFRVVLLVSPMSRFCCCCLIVVM